MRRPSHLAAQGLIVHGPQDHVPLITEPVIVDFLYSTGAAMQRTPHAVHLVFCVQTPEIRNEVGEFDSEVMDDTGERRILARIAMPIDGARLFARSLNRALKEGGD